MILALTLLFTGLAAAQTNEDARARVLLQEIASSSRAAKNWIAEGVEVSDLIGPGMDIHSESRLRVAHEGPSKMRYEQTTLKETVGGRENDHPYPSGTLHVCDGIDHWTHYLPSTGFSRAEVGVSACNIEIGDFSKITENLVTATLAGRDKVEFAGALLDCELVRAE